MRHRRLPSYPTTIAFLLLQSTLPAPSFLPDHILSSISDIAHTCHSCLKHVDLASSFSKLIFDLRARFKIASTTLGFDALCAGPLARLARFNWDCDCLCFRISSCVAIGLCRVFEPPLHALLNRTTEVSRSSLHTLTTPQQDLFPMLMNPSLALFEFTVSHRTMPSIEALSLDPFSLPSL